VVKGLEVWKANSQRIVEVLLNRNEKRKTA